MMATETPLVFSCAAEPVIGIVHLPERPARLGVILIVGGPQYRVGSHRQFVSLARALATGGFACLRFDYRGMGDSAAPQRSFDAIHDDVGAAIDTLLQACPGVDGVVLWGLCDGASAALMYAPQDPRVAGIIALNPWVRTEASLAAARLNHYYRGQVLSARFWKRLFSGEVRLARSVSGFASAVHKRLRGAGSTPVSVGTPVSFIDRMGIGWGRMRGKVLVVLSGNDLTAREFADFCRARPEWQAAVAPGPNFVEIADADHTFSTRDWKHRVEQATLDWLRSLLGVADSPAPGVVSPDAQAMQFQRSA